MSVCGSILLYVCAALCASSAYAAYEVAYAAYARMRQHTHSIREQHCVRPVRMLPHTLIRSVCYLIRCYIRMRVQCAHTHSYASYATSYADAGSVCAHWTRILDAHTLPASAYEVAYDAYECVSAYARTGRACVCGSV
jgi:hypothetical protein